MLTMDIHGVELSAADFPKDLQGYIAFSIAMACNTRCRDGQALKELLMSEAENIIERCRIGKPPTMDETPRLLASSAIELIDEACDDRDFPDMRQRIKDIIMDYQDGLK